MKGVTINNLPYVSYMGPSYLVPVCYYNEETGSYVTRCISYSDMVREITEAVLNNASEFAEYVIAQREIDTDQYTKLHQQAELGSETLSYVTTFEVIDSI